MCVMFERNPPSGQGTPLCHWPGQMSIPSRGSLRPWGSGKAQQRSGCLNWILEGEEGSLRRGSILAKGRGHREAGPASGIHVTVAQDAKEEIRWRNREGTVSREWGAFNSGQLSQSGRGLGALQAGSDSYFWTVILASGEYTLEGDCVWKTSLEAVPLI